MRLALQFGTAVLIARMTHAVLNLHWYDTPLPPRETMLALQFNVYAIAGTLVPPRDANLALQIQAYAQTCTPVQEQCGTATPRMRKTWQSNPFPNGVKRDLEIEECKK